MKIHLPDKGLTLNFPDGMTEDQMRDAINRNFYPEKLSAQPPAPAVPQPARTMPEPPPQPTAPEDYYPPEFAGFADPNLAANVEREIREYGSTDRNAPNYWDLGTIGKGLLKGIAGLGTRKAERADIETARAFRQSNAPTHRPNLLELGMAAMSDPSVLDVQDGEKQARAAAEIEAYNSATRAQALRENAEWWDPGEYHAPMEGMGKVLHDLAVNAPYTLKNMPLAAAATLVAGPYGAITGSLPGALGEGLDEGAEVYKRLIEKGVDPDDAYKQYLSHADKIGLGLMLSDPLQNMATFGLGKLFPNAGAVTRTLGGLLFDMGSEGAEEVLEGMAANKAVGDPNDWNELGYEGLLGALSGGLFGGGGMAVNAIANAMAKQNASAGTETGAAPEPPAPVAEVLEELRKEDDARQALPRGERGELMRWARSETGRMAEEAQFAEDGTPENPLSEADLVRYQEIQDAMKRKDYAALSAMRGEAGAPQSVVWPESSREDAAMELAPEAAKVVAPRKGRYTDMDEFVAAATSPEGKKIGGSIWIDFDPISDETADKIQESTGIDVHGYGHALDGSSVVHILNRHGPKGSAFKDFPHQLPITPDDFNLMPEVLENPDVIENTRGASSGNERIIFKKKVNGHALLVEEVRGRLGKLIPVSMWKEKSEAVSPTSETSPTPSGPVSAASPSGLTLPPSGEDVNARTFEDGENFEGYEQQDVGPAGTAPEQADSSKTKGAKRSRTPAEIRRLGKEVEARMIAAGRDVKEAKAMGLLASEFADRFAKRTGIQPAEALNFEMRQGKAQGARGSGYDQSSVRQSEDYDYSDPKTWPEGPARDEALRLKTWQNFEPDGEIETWPESPEKTEALALREEYGEIEAWVENLSREEFERRLWSDDPEFVRKNERGEEIENRLRVLARRLRKKKPKGAEGRLLQLIEAEEEAAAREAQEAEEYYQSASRGGAHQNIDKEYFAALEAGDMETAQKIVDEQARQKGYERDSEYRIDHRAPNSKYDDNLATIRESGLVPDDYWTKPQWYQSSGEEYEAFYAVKKALDSPRKTIRMYRAIPKGVKESDFRNGDWITPSRAYAQMEGQEIPGGYRIITDVVKTKDVWWDGNSICEFGYDDGKGYAYKDTRNNRKLTEVIVRDSDGAIIPPSKRFNSRRFETYYQRQAEETENIRRGQAAMEKVIAEQTDVMDAMHRDDLGSISFLWGESGRGPKFKGGSGVSHIIAHRNAQGYDGEAVARKMVEVIAKGKVDRRYGAEVPGGERANIVYDGHTAALSLYKDGDRKTWLLTGWKDYEEKAPGEVGPVYDGLNPTLSKATRFHPEEGAGAFNEKSPGASSEGDGSTGATLSGPMRTRPEEGAGDSDNSKPPVAQKDKGESTAPNGRTYFLPDGTSVIEFFETANKSTSFHEFGHHVLNKMVEFSGMEGVDPQLAEDVKTILEEAGVSREAFDADTDGARTRAHEFFARGFETYLSEGKAPTARLRDAFRRIRNWMIEVYNDTAKALGIKLSNEMRGVYDRLFASDGAFGDIYGAEDARSGEKIPDGMIRTERKSGVVVDKKARDTSNDTRMMDLFNSPSVVAKRHGKFRPFFGMAKEAVEKQERMRSNWNKAVDAIYGRKGRGGLLSKEQVSLFNETLLEGDALGKAFSADELQERGFDNSMARAYRLVRGLYDNAHRMLSAQRNKYGKEDVAYREGYVPHFFHTWRVLEGGKIVTSFRSMNEAIKAAEKMKKEGENRNIRVAPALDDFGGRGKLDAVTLGDMQYFKLAGNVEKAFDLSADEARALLEGAARMKGRSRVFKNAWERKGVAGFDANMEYALRHYLNLSARYIAMDTLKHDGINLFERTFGRFDNDHKGLARYTKDYINDVLGVPSDVEQTLNNWIRNSWLGKYLPNIIGDRPATVAANSIASLVAHCKLGFLNIASAAMNLSQLNGTQAIIGPIWTARGLKEYLHPNQTTLRLYADAGVEENITAENPSGYSKVHQARGLLADTSMMAFRLVDGMARKVTLIGAYRKALSQGMNRSAAIEYAKQVNDDVNFDYSVADAPNFIRRTGPIGTLLFQFKKFPVKMLELALPGVGKLKGMEQVRFWAPLVALTGVFGLPGFDWLKDWLKSIFGKDLELETKKLIAESSLPEPVKRTILYGALSNLGIDIGRRAGMGDFFPSELKDLTGPAAATVARVAESLPKIFDDGNFMDTIEALSPGLANPIKAVMGEARDRRRDRVAFRYETPGERIARATGARPIREAIENDAVRIARYEQQKRSAAEADAIDDFIRAREDSDARALDRARDRLRKLRITPDRIRAEMIRRRSPDGGESTAYERAMRGARTPRRIQDYRAMENYAAMWE